MLEFFKFIFSEFIYFLGFLILLGIPCGAIANIGTKHCSKCETCANYEKKEDNE